MKNMIQVFVAVFFANLCVLVLYESYQAFKSSEITQTVSSISEQTGVGMEDMMRAIADEAVSSKLGGVSNGNDSADKSTTLDKETEQKIKKAEKMCQFWSDHLKKEASSQNRTMKLRACLRVDQLKRKAGIEEE